VDFTFRRVTGTRKDAVVVDGRTVGYVAKTGSSRTYLRWEAHRADGKRLANGRTFTNGSTKASVAESLVRDDMERSDG
jgi:hypothetical protein